MTLATPPERSGAGSAVQNTVRQVGASLGVAILSSVVATIYAGKLRPSVANLPESARTAALDDIQSAAGVAQKLGGTAGQALIDSANTAFLHALHWAAILSALMTVVAAAVILWRLPAQAETVAWAVAPPVEGHRHPDTVVIAEPAPDLP